MSAIFTPPTWTERFSTGAPVYVHRDGDVTVTRHGARWLVTAGAGAYSRAETVGTEEEALALGIEMAAERRR